MQRKFLVIGEQLSVTSDQLPVTRETFGDKGEYLFLNFEL
jgi:hypothetical protein